MKMEDLSNVVPIGKGKEIREAKEAEIIAIEEPFAGALQKYRQEHPETINKSDWAFKVSHFIAMLCREPGSINGPRMTHIADLLVNNDGTAGFLEEAGEDTKAHVYRTGDTCLRQALDFYWSNEGKLPLPKDDQIQR
jgi:hypothetical protein